MLSLQQSKTKNILGWWFTLALTDDWHMRKWSSSGKCSNTGDRLRCLLQFRHYLKGNCGISAREFPLYLWLLFTHGLGFCFWLTDSHALAIHRTQWRWGTPVHIPCKKCFSSSPLISCLLIKEESEFKFVFKPHLTHWAAWRVWLSIRASFWLFELRSPELFSSLILRASILYSFILSQENTLQGKKKSYIFAIFDPKPKYLLGQEDVLVFQMFSAAKSGLASPMARAGKGTGGSTTQRARLQQARTSAALLWALVR